jgi:Protein of unknown function (DUF2971)
VTDSLHHRLSSTLVYSMAAACDNPKMWGAYGDNSRGYCLEFRNAGIFENAREVCYRDDFQLDVGDASHVTDWWLFFKQTSWSTEQEIPLVVPEARVNSRQELEFQPAQLKRIISWPIRVAVRQFADPHLGNQQKSQA